MSDFSQKSNFATVPQVLGEGGSNKSGTTRVFASQRLTDQEIINYAQSLCGEKPLQKISSSPDRYYAVLSDGSTINLRNISKSKNDTKSRWTIDIIDNKNVANGVGKKVRNVEIKFR